jgi:hypothetical protein
LLNVPNIRPIFDDDLANWVHLDVSRERELNYLRQLDNAPAGLPLKFAEGLVSTQAASCRKLGDRRVSFRNRIGEAVDLLGIRMKNSRF